MYCSTKQARDLWQATSDGDYTRVSALIEQGANTNHKIYWSAEWKLKNPPLHTACKNGKLQIVRLLVEKGGADINRGNGIFNRTPLHWACLNGHKSIVMYLFNEAKCDIGE